MSVIQGKRNAIFSTQEKKTINSFGHEVFQEFSWLVDLQERSDIPELSEWMSNNSHLHQGDNCKEKTTKRITGEVICEMLTIQEYNLHTYLIKYPHIIFVCVRFFVVVLTPPPPVITQKINILTYSKNLISYPGS